MLRHRPLAATVAAACAAVCLISAQTPTTSRSGLVFTSAPSAPVRPSTNRFVRNLAAIRRLVPHVATTSAKSAHPAPTHSTPTTTPTVPSTTTTTAPPAPVSPFVTACGTHFCLDGKTWNLFEGSDLVTLDNPDAESQLAVQAGVNTIRIVNFLDESASPATATYDETKWDRLDRVIASAQQYHLHVEVDLSTYRNLLANAGVDPYKVDWEPFLSFFADRINTVTGVRYRDDPTVALVALAGEPDSITNNPNNTLGITTSELTAFYDRTLSEFKALDPNHLVTTGGFLQLNWNSGIDWQSIMKLPADDVCDIHVYSVADQTMTLPAVASLCASLGKPWITEEFGFPISTGDAARAADFVLQFALQKEYGSAGVGFWNLGPQTDPSTYDVGPAEPLTFAAVQNEAVSLR